MSELNKFCQFSSHQCFKSEFRYQFCILEESGGVAVGKMVGGWV